MTPAARVESAITLLSLIEGSGEPPDRIAGRFFRERRFIGSKDRRAIGDLAYQVLRSRARLDWWRGRTTDGAALDRDRPGAATATLSEEQAVARQRVIAALALERDAAAVAALFDGSRYGPAPLEADERAVAEALDGKALDHPEQPDWVGAELPQWLLPLLRENLGASLPTELAALAQSAPLDLRVNSLRGDREAARRALDAEGIEAAPTPLSPLGLRVAGRHQLPAVAAFRGGLVEVQDEGSQIVTLMCDARPGLAVADFCAGAGGKTLALGAAMQGPRERGGKLVALDSDAGRLARARPRLARAGLPEVEIHAIAEGEDAWLETQAGAFDRVLVDAPCSGSGTWRRDPAARWRLTPTDLGRYCDLQRRVLALAAPLVKPGGRLIYATCSLLAQENQQQAAGFLARNGDFAPLPLAPLWAAAGLGGPCPAPDSAGAGELLLTPAQHGTDGFYVAVLQRAQPHG